MSIKVADITQTDFLKAMTRTTMPNHADLSEVAEVLGFPRKVVLAKARKLIRQGVSGGCDCGCRGNFYPASEVQGRLGT